MGEGILAHFTKGVVNRRVDTLVNTGGTGAFTGRAKFLAAVKQAAAHNSPLEYLTIIREQAGVH